MNLITNKARVLIALALLCAVAGCHSKQAQRQSEAVPQLTKPNASNTAQPGGSDAAPDSYMQSTAAALLKPEASQALAFINDRFVATNCTLENGSTWTICSRNGKLSVSGDKLVMSEDFEEDYSDGRVKRSHEDQMVSTADLDLETLEVSDWGAGVGTGEIHLTCKNGLKCVETVETGGENTGKPSDRLSIGDFARKDVDDVGNYLKRLVAVQQGATTPATTHEPTEEEALSFVRTHVARTVDFGNGITGFNRSITLDGDDLVESEDLTRYGSSPERLVVSVNLKDVDDTVILGDNGEIGLVCRVVSSGVMPNCFVANTGQSSSNHVIQGVSNGGETVKMLRRIIILHQ